VELALQLIDSAAVASAEEEAEAGHVSRYPNRYDTRVPEFSKVGGTVVKSITGVSAADLMGGKQDTVLIDSCVTRRRKLSSRPWMSSWRVGPRKTFCSTSSSMPVWHWSTRRCSPPMNLKLVSPR
jgi:hypothetical protein